MTNAAHVMLAVVGATILVPGSREHVCPTAVTVVAGSGEVGDGGPATGAVLSGISALAVDARGNLYISDVGNNRVRRVDARTRLITTVAGSGTIGAQSSSGTAASEAYTTPGPIALDPTGNFLYVAEIVTSRVRRVDLMTGAAEDLGAPPGGFGKDIFGQPILLLPQPTHVFVVDPVRSRIWRYADRQWTSLPTDADGFGGGLRSGVVTRSGDLLLSEFFAHRIRRWDRRTGKLTTVVGTGAEGRSPSGTAADQAQIRTPDGLALDADGNLYFSDTGNNRICKVDLRTNRLTTLHELGASGSGLSWMPGPIALDGRGHLWVGDIGHGRVLRFRRGSPDPDIVAGGGSIGDGGPAARARLAHPNRMAFDARGNLYFADAMFHRVRVVETTSGTIRTVAGTGVPGYSGDGGPGPRAQLSYPAGLVVAPDERLYVADYYNNRVRSIDLRTGVISTVAGTGVAGVDGDGGPAASASLLNPHALALDDDNHLLVTSAVSPSIRRIDRASGRIESVPLDSRLVPPQATVIFFGIAAKKGGFYLADGLRNIIYSYGRGGLFPVITGRGLHYPTDVAVSRDGDLYICDTRNNRIVKWAGGELQLVIGGLGRPRGVIVDSSGDLYIAETFHSRVLKVCPRALARRGTAIG